MGLTYFSRALGSSGAARAVAVSESEINFSEFGTKRGSAASHPHGLAYRLHLRPGRRQRHYVDEPRRPRPQRRRGGRRGAARFRRRRPARRRDGTPTATASPTWPQTRRDQPDPGTQGPPAERFYSDSGKGLWDVRETDPPKAGDRTPRRRQNRRAPDPTTGTRGAPGLTDTRRSRTPRPGAIDRKAPSRAAARPGRVARPGR